MSRKSLKIVLALFTHYSYLTLTTLPNIICVSVVSKMDMNERVSHITVGIDNCTKDGEPEVV